MLAASTPAAARRLPSGLLCCGVLTPSNSVTGQGPQSCLHPAQQQGVASWCGGPEPTPLLCPPSLLVLRLRAVWFSLCCLDGLLADSVWRPPLGLGQDSLCGRPLKPCQVWSSPESQCPVTAGPSLRCVSLTPTAQALLDSVFSVLISYVEVPRDQ